jgi:hypothetical protein
MPKQTFLNIQQAVNSGNLHSPFKPSDVDRVLKITYAGVFLPKHRVGNPGGNTELFVQVATGLYRIK